MNLKELTNKKNNYLVRRGNKAILQALRFAKLKGYSRLYLANEGSWVTYGQYGKKLKFNIRTLKTNKGIINFGDVGENSVVLFNDMPSYAFLQNEFNTELFKKRKILTIGDITGSIGTRICKADILVCSFGKHKIVNLGLGGVIASDFDMNIEEDFEGSTEELNKKIENVPSRLKFLREKREKIIQDIGKENIIKYDKKGINLLTPKEDFIFKYCEDNNILYKICPMNIKILEDAISIEVQTF